MWTILFYTPIIDSYQIYTPTIDSHHIYILSMLSPFLFDLQMLVDLFTLLIADPNKVFQEVSKIAM